MCCLSVGIPGRGRQKRLVTFYDSDEAFPPQSAEGLQFIGGGVSAAAATTNL